MAKSQVSVRQTKVETQQGTGQHLEHTQVFDDNFLQDSEELEKIKAVDPRLIDLIIECTKKEQDFRHKNVLERNRIVSQNARGERRINFVGLFFSFSYLVFGTYYSFQLIFAGNEILGSVFSGVMLLSAASMLANRKVFIRNEKPPSEKKK